MCWRAKRHTRTTVQAVFTASGRAQAGTPAFSCNLPAPVKKQKQLAAKLDTLHEATQRLESIYKQKLAALNELKKSLLHKAFSGAL